jgi:hypothetical protein
LLKTLFIKGFHKEFSFLGREILEVFGNCVDLSEFGKFSRFGTFGFLAKFLLWLWAVSREVPYFSTVEIGTFVGTSDAEV